jgi:AcrR family transcriptional regulator
MNESFSYDVAMARRRPPARLEELARAAIEVFSARGYRRTQMADVARRLGVSPGALYGYVTSKEALFDLAVRTAFGERPRATALPLPTPEPEELLRHVRSAMRREIRRSSMDALLAQPVPPDVRAELTELLRELYEGLARNAVAIRLLERSAADRPDLARLYFARGRSELIGRWERYLARRIEAGKLRPVPDVAIAARLVIETVAWFAWHRHGDPVPQPMDDELARDTVVAVLARGLLPGDSP